MSGKKSLDSDSYEDESDESSRTTNTQPRMKNSVHKTPRKLPTGEGNISDDKEHIEYEKDKISDNLDDSKNELSLKPVGNTYRIQSEFKEEYELDLEKYPRKESHKDIKVSSRTQVTEDNVTGNDLYEHDVRDVRIYRQKKADDYVERKKSKDNMSYEHVASDSGSETVPERKVEKQDEKISEKNIPNNVGKKKISHSTDETNSESDQYYESDCKGKPARKDRGVENVTQKRFSSKDNFDRNMPKYIEESESDYSESTRSEKQNQLAGKKVSRLCKRTTSGIRGGEVDQLSNSRKEMTTQSFSESDSDSDNNHSKNVKYQREMSHDSVRKSTKGKNRHKELEDESLSELSDGFAVDKEMSRREEAYMKNAPRRKNVISQNARGSGSDSREQSYTPKEKMKHQQNSDEEEFHGKSYHKRMECIEKTSNPRARKEHLSVSNRKKNDALGYSKEEYPTNRESKSTHTGSDSESEYSGYKREKFKHQSSDEKESYGKSFHKQMGSQRNEFDSHSNRRVRKERMSAKIPKEGDALPYSKEKYPTNREDKPKFSGSDSESEYSGFKREKFEHQQNSDEYSGFKREKFKHQQNREDKPKLTGSDSESEYSGFKREKFEHQQNSDEYSGFKREKFKHQQNSDEYSGFKREKIKHQQNSDEEESYGKSFHKQMISIDKNSSKRNELDSHSSRRLKEEHLSSINIKEDDALEYSKEKFPTNREIKSTYRRGDSESESQDFRKESVKDYDRYESHSDNPMHIQTDHGSLRDFNNKRKEASQYEDYSKRKEVSQYEDYNKRKEASQYEDYNKRKEASQYKDYIKRKEASQYEDYNKRKEVSQYEDNYDHSRGFPRRGNEMRRESPELTNYEVLERDEDRHYMNRMSRDKKGRDADLVTHHKHKAQSGRTCEEKDPTYWTRLVDDDGDRHYQSYKGQNRKPPYERSYNSDEDNRNHNSLRSQQISVSHQKLQTGRRYDKSVMNRQSQELSPVFLINLLLQRKKPKASMNSLMKVGLRPKDISLVIHENSHLFNVSTGANLEETLYLCPQIYICHAHVSVGCTDKLSCRDLHICPRYIQSLCNSPNCVLGHRLRSRHNRDILGYFYLDECPEPEVLKLLKLSLPPVEITKHLNVCNDYISRKCKLSNCVGLHICPEYLLQMKCNTANCQLNHNLLLTHNCEILENVGIDTNESPRDVMKVIKDKYPSIFKQQLPYSNSKSLSKQTGRQQSGGRDVEPIRKVQHENRSNDNGNRNQGRNFMKTPTYSASSENGNRNQGRNFMKTPTYSASSENYQFTSTTREVSTVWHDYYQGSTLIPEICYFSVTGKCRYEEEGCKRLHADRHFHWQVKLKGNTWINLRNNQVEALEKSYCEPAQDGVSVPPVDRTNCPKEMLNLFGRDNWQAHFTAMVLRNTKSQTLDLRRICSENVNGNVKCAKYLWYFLDQNNVWIQYGNVDTTNRGFLTSDVTSEDIENQYLRNPNASITFKNSMFTYLLDFKLMTQTNTSTKVTRKVRRRPMPHLKAKSTWSFNFFNQS
ncbi:myb-like protein X [Palaemon carinicauda]|uniref:myb-like protein X n=1 Tax=Palaemon carinicauda TaxID=392227 RepID=UPI0035B58CDD